jgi:phage-related minor tail protein
MPPLLILLLILGFTAANVAATLYLIGVLKMNFDELAAQLLTYASQLAKVKTEVQALKDTIANTANVPQNVIDAANAVGAALGEVDDLNQDA